jgi:putative hemolysin
LTVLSAAENTIEVGRSCVSPEHRDGTVVALLWGGIAEIVYRSRLRYMFGCVSLEDTNPASGWAIYEHLKTMGKISDQIFAEGLPKCVMPRPPQEEIDAILNDRKLLRGLIPPLFKGYLRLGAKICGEPVFDHEFGTIDFLILLDVSGLPERYIKHFNVASVG